MTLGNRNFVIAVLESCVFSYHSIGTGAQTKKKVPKKSLTQNELNLSGMGWVLHETVAPVFDIFFFQYQDF